MTRDESERNKSWSKLPDLFVGERGGGGGGGGRDGVLWAAEERGV